MSAEHFNLLMRVEDLECEKLTCLDLGCGPYTSSVAKQMPEIPWKELTAVEGFAPDLEEAKKLKYKAKKVNFVLGDVREIEGSYDVITSFDVLEHMTKEDGNKWLELMEQHAKKRIILAFPLEPFDFHRQNEWPENPLQEHLSHWRPHELQAKGYEVKEYFGTHREQKEDGSHVSFGYLWAIKNLR